MDNVRDVGSKKEERPNHRIKTRSYGVDADDVGTARPVRSCLLRSARRASSPDTVPSARLRKRFVASIGSLPSSCSGGTDGDGERGDAMSAPGPTY